MHKPVNDPRCPFSPPDDPNADLKQRRSEAEESVRKGHAERRYPAAFAAFDEWWKLGHFELADGAFLTLAADLCNRMGDAVRGDKIEEHLAEHGTPAQCARALRILDRRWFGTPKQLRLNDVYRHALERLPELRDDQEVDALGSRLAR